MEISGAAIVIKSLIDAGVDTIFGYPGGAVLPIYDEIFKQNHIRHILVRHEQAAVHAAEGYARSTGKVGVVLVTSGPGATNAITGLTDALLDSIPIICLTGQVPTYLIGSDAFQEADTVGLTRPCTKHNYLVKNVDAIERTIKEAFYIARSGRPGPVVVDLPKDTQNLKTTYRDIKINSRPSYRPAFTADDSLIDAALDQLTKAKRPVVYSGGGIINSGPRAAELLTEFVRLTGFPITSTLMGLGAYPADDPQFLNMLGMHGSCEANMAMARCDVMLNLGARFDDRVTGKLSNFSPDSFKIHVDIDKSSINKTVPVQLGIVGDVGYVLERMIQKWRERNLSVDKKSLEQWWEQIKIWRARNSFSYRQSGAVIKPQYALDRLNKALHERGDFFISTDVGQHQMWAAQYLQFNSPNRWMTSGGLGTMGYGLPAAIGTQIAHPEKPVVCVTGEASILMNIHELSTAIQYRLPVKIFILNNHYMGMVRQWQELFHGNRHSESYMDALPDFSKLAAAFGWTGLRCEDPGEVDSAIETMMSTPGPVILDMWVDRTENVYPMIPAGAAHDEMEFGPEDKVEVDKAEASMQV
jgi:acetolactate synthase-1/2/3 large subunit